MKVSSKGQTRKAPSAATWCAALLELSRHGERDPLATLTTWNAQASKNDRVVGGKYAAVKTLLDFPESVRSQIMEEISIFGFEGALAAEMYVRNNLVHSTARTVTLLQDQRFLKTSWPARS